MENKEIYIICNSPRALNLIGSGFTGLLGNIPILADLDKKDLFTCNNAFTFFKTGARHFNFWTDPVDIYRHLFLPETLSDNYQENVKHIFSRHSQTMKNGGLLFNDRPLMLTPFNTAASTGLNALAYACLVLGYETVFFIGYTLKEANNPLWLDVKNGYNMGETREGFFTFLKKQ